MSKLIILARQAIEAHKAGDLRRAEKLYRAVLKREQNNADAQHLLGVVLHQSGQTEAAANHLKEAVTLRPFDPEILNNFGVCLNALGRFREAAVELERAVELNGLDHSACCNLGVAYRGLRRFEAAKALFKRALALNPHAYVYSNLGLVYLDLDDAASAIVYFESAVALDPNWAQARVHLGFTLQRLARLPEAIAQFDMALIFDPAHGQALAQRCHLRQILCDWCNLSADRIALSGQTGAWREKDPPSPFTVLALTDDPQIQHRRASDYARSFASNRPIGSRRTLGNTEGKIKVAYLSPDFRRHPVAALIVDILECHDRTLFDITALSYGPDDGSSLRSKVTTAVDHFIDVATWSDAEIAEFLRTTRIDIVVDLAGFTALSRPAILVERPVPIQVNYLGYPGTTGADWIDYTIGDAFLSEGCRMLPSLSEAMVSLPGSFQANSRRPNVDTGALSRISQGLPENTFVFCAFGSSYKLTPEIFGTWLKLLRAVPASVLWLLGEHEETRVNLLRETEAGGVEPERLVFAQRATYEEYLNRLPLADLFLDTFPYNSGTTAADALWMGVPLLTLTGAAYASRMAGSLLTALDLPELITTDLSAYEAMAYRLATNPGLLAHSRDRLTDRLRSNPDLFNPVNFTRKLEFGFLEMIKRERQGLKAIHLDLSSS